MSRDPIQDLIARLEQLPGIGRKTATRLAFFLLGAPREYLLGLAGALESVAREVRRCSVCSNFTLEDPCTICSDVTREQDLICVVATPQDLAAVENSGAYRGTYHVLHGLLSPLDGKGPEDITLKRLLDRVQSAKIREVILALSPSVEGEATAAYLSGLLKPHVEAITRIATGVPMGGELEYADRLTLGKALADRRPV